MNPLELEYDKSFSRYISPSHRWWDDYRWEEQPRGHYATITRMKELIDQGFKVKCGYATTSVRGFHQYIIFYK